MKKLFDLRCPECNTVFEAFIEADVGYEKCPQCSHHRAVVILTGDRSTYRRTDQRANHVTLDDLRWRNS